MKKTKSYYKNIMYPDALSDLSVGVDEERFLAARAAVIAEAIPKCGVGTLTEKSLHKMLKLYIEPDVSLHEVKYLSSVADIKNSNGVYEIQTRAFNKLGPKLKKMLPEGRVNVVCPLSYNKSVRWIDPESGEFSEPKKSPKHENVYDALFNLFGIREHLKNENLSVMLIYLDAEEYRMLDGWDKSRKRGSNRLERIPTKILDVITIDSYTRYSDFIPSELGESFVASELSAIIGRSSRFTYYVLKALVGAGALKEDGKRGKAIIYKRT